MRMCTSLCVFAAISGAVAAPTINVMTGTPPTKPAVTLSHHGTHRTGREINQTGNCATRLCATDCIPGVSNCGWSHRKHACMRVSIEGDQKWNPTSFTELGDGECSSSQPAVVDGIAWMASQAATAVGRQRDAMVSLRAI